MKNCICLFIGIYFVALNSFAQLNYFEITPEVIDKSCTHNLSDPVPQLKNWLVFQTIDGKIDGEIDTTIKCFASYNFGFRSKIDLSKIDPKRPVIIRPFYDKDNSIKLLPNKIYKVNFKLLGEEGLFLSQVNCGSSSCNRLRYQNRYINEEGNGYLKKEEIITPVNFEQSLKNELSFNYCFPTSKIDLQFYDSLQISFWVDSNVWKNNPFIYIYPLSGNTFNDYQVITTDLSIDAAFAVNGIIDAEISYLNEFKGESFFLLHSKNGYPSSNNLDYKFIKIVPNPSTIHTINLSIYETQNLYIQDYVVLTPEAVKGNPALSHVLNIIQDGENICLYSSERLFRHANFIYRSGLLEIGGSTACLMFYDKNKFIIDEGASLKYGNDGTGILALRNGSVEVKKEASIEIDGQIMLMSENETNSTIHLDFGSTLSFTPFARIINGRRTDEKLCIKGYPFQVDMHWLPVEFRDKIYFEIPENQISGDNAIVPNPANDKIYLTGPFNGMNFKIFTLDGNLESSGVIIDNSVNINFLKTGIKILKVGAKSLKFIKL